MKKFVVALATGATLMSMLPSQADPLSQRDMAKVIQQAPKRYLASEPGKQEQLTLLFGPYEIPPGQDSNRILADIQLPNGYVKSVSPDLVDAASGRVPTEQEAHIHHAHWFRVTADDDELYYSNLAGRGDLPEFVPQELANQVPEGMGLSWVFGTGEEKTQGGFAPREALEDADGNGVPDRQYGMEIDETERQVVIFMIHNKTAAPLQVFVVLDVDWVWGTAEEISAATRIPMHPVKGQLWGTTADVSPNTGQLVSTYTAELDSTAIVAGGHAHPGVYNNALTNTGPNGACTADLDDDGLPGITILNARKIDHVPGSWPYSEDFQMGVAKYGWRVNIHKGDKLRQVAVYDVTGDGKDAGSFALPPNVHATAEDPKFPSAADLAGRDTVDMRPHQHFDAMNHYGIYLDPLQEPAPYLNANGTPWNGSGCPANFASVAPARLLGNDTPAVQQKMSRDDEGIPPYFATGINEGMQNHVWPALDPTCGDFAHSTRTECEGALDPKNNGEGIETDVIHIAGFQYYPGGYGLPGALGAPAKVSKSGGLTILNEDVAGNIRHSLTTCVWPCSGGYVSNYPLSDGTLHTGKLGNADPIDGGGNGPEDLPNYSVNMSKLDVGEFYSYYCTIHPTMRGSFEVVA